MNVMSLARFRSPRGSLVLVGVAALALVACGGGTTKKASIGGGGSAPSFDDCLTDPATVEQIGMIGDADIAHGGRLYDAWFEATAATDDEPTKTNPLWAELPKATSTATGADTWRCKVCHGWDYAGAGGNYNVDNVEKYTGVAGLLEFAQEFGETEPEQIFCAIKSGVDETNGNHSFGAQMGDEDVLALTKFVAQQGVIDTAEYIAPNAGTIGDPVNGKTLYADLGCGSGGCHKADGSRNAGDETLGLIAKENPWEFLHKVRFGDPANPESMYAFEQVDGVTAAQIMDIIAYAQESLKDGGGSVILPDPPITGGGGAVSKFTGLVLGGRLYDNHFEVLNKMQTVVNPLFETQVTNTNDGASWRCKECHGWDYKGADGVYGKETNSHYTGFPGILENRFAAMKDTLSEQDALAAAFNYLKNGFTDGTLGIVVHSFGVGSNGQSLMAGSPGLDDTQVQALAEFVVNGLVDSSSFILNGRGQKEVLGDPVAGEALYNAPAGATGGGCGDAKACHGADGKAIDFNAANPAAGVEYLGTIARDNPWETFHKISFGHPGTELMPSSVANGMTTAQIVNMLDYAQSLPTQ